MSFKGYAENCWEISAGLGPGFSKQRGVGHIEQQFYGYVARGIPFRPDDGTLAPWAVVASLPFAPEIVLAALRHFRDSYPEILSKDGLLTSFNLSFDTSDGAHRVWLAPEHHGLDQGPVAMMENYRSGLLWRLMR